MKTAQQGFSLLEAIVALVILSTAGLALFNWINTNLITLQRVQTVQQKNEAIRNGLAFLKNINPLEKPTGKEEIGIYTFDWESEVLEAPQDGINARSGTLSLYQVALYNVTTRIYQHEQLVTEFTVRKVGYQQVRTLDVF